MGGGEFTRARSASTAIRGPRESVNVIGGQAQKPEFGTPTDSLTPSALKTKGEKRLRQTWFALGGFRLAKP